MSRIVEVLIYVAVTLVIGVAIYLGLVLLGAHS